VWNGRLCLAFFSPLHVLSSKRGRFLPRSPQTRISPNKQKSPLPVQAPKNPPLLWPNGGWCCQCVLSDPRRKDEHQNFQYKGRGTISSFWFHLHGTHWTAVEQGRCHFQYQRVRTRSAWRAAVSCPKSWQKHRNSERVPNPEKIWNSPTTRRF
jgi:hypothetical protein